MTLHELSGTYHCLGKVYLYQQCLLSWKLMADDGDEVVPTQYFETRLLIQTFLGGFDKAFMKSRDSLSYSSNHNSKLLCSPFFAIDSGRNPKLSATSKLGLSIIQGSLIYRIRIVSGRD